MGNPSDTLFIEMAIAKGYLDRSRADEAAGIQRATADDGADRRLLSDILVEEGWMTREQVAEVRAQIDEGAVHTGRIEGYRLLAKIGQGGMGAVYKAQNEASGETVALKILPTRMAQKRDFVERFLREARSASKVRSDHLVRTVDVGFSGGYYYFAMEYVDGESVDTTLSIDGPLPESRALRIVHQIAQALRDVDRGALVHRDVKPGNILVREDGVAKLTDFGLARELADDSVTQTGVTLGTPNYMSPEQARAMKSLDIRSDIYSLGVTFYHMVTGAVPFHGDTSLLTMLKHLNEAPVAPMTRRPDLSRGSNDIILKMLAKGPDDRYRTPDQLITDLELAIAGKAPRYAPSTEPAPAAAAPRLTPPEEVQEFAREIRRGRRLRAFKTFAAAFFVLLLAALIWLFFFSSRGGPDTGGRGSDAEKTAAAARLERVARAALQEATAFAEKNPAELAAIARRYADVEAQYRATKAGVEARRLAERAQQKLDAAVDGALNSTRAAAEALALRDRFGAAIEAWESFAPALRTARAADRIEQAKRDLERRAWDRFAEIRREGERLLESRKLSAARLAVEPAKDFGISGIEAEARKLLARIGTEELAAGSEENRLALEEYVAAIGRIRGLVRKGQFDGALTELNNEVRRSKYDLMRTLAPANRRIIQEARPVWGNVLTGVQAMQPGTKFMITGVACSFVSYDAPAERMEVNTSLGRTSKLSPGWLPPDTLREMAVSGSGGKTTAAALAAFFVARGEYQIAAAELENAKKENAPPDLVKVLDDQLSLLLKTREEIEAENLLTRAREAATTAGNAEQTARTLWELITNYANTACCTQNRQEIEALLAKAEAECITADTLFAVRPTPTADGFVELKYDFSDPAHAADWSPVWEKRPYGRWTIHPRYGEMAAESGLVYFVVPLRGDFRVEFSALDLRSASVRFGLSNPTVSARAGGYTFTWKRAGESAVSSLQKAGKRLAPDNEVNPFRQVGALRIALEVTGGVLTAKVADRTVLRVPLQGKPEELAQPGYLVLDDFNMGARVTGLTVKFKLDKEWLEKNYAEPLRKAKIEEARWSMAQYTPLLPGNDASAWRLMAAGDSPRAAWTFSQGYAVAPENASCVMTVGDVDWSDYAFSAKLRFGTGVGSARLMVRWNDTAPRSPSGQGYFLELKTPRGAGAPGTLVLGKSSTGRDETLKEASINLTASDWYQLYVEARGKALRVLLGGREVLSAEDESFGTGRVGLAAFRCGAQFSDIKIKLMK